VHRQLTILYDAVDQHDPDRLRRDEPITIKIRSMFAREPSAPWVTARDYTISLGKAIDYIRAPHPGSTRGAEHTTQEE
jgi:hypothetical protein